MRILVNFMLRVDSWFVHAMTEDGATPISAMITVKDEATLYRLLRYVGATPEDLERAAEDIRRWSRGSVPITLAPGRKNLLQIREPWNKT